MNIQQLCKYGCGQPAKYDNLCCSKSHNSCPVLRKKNSNKIKELYKDPNSIYNNKEHQKKHIDSLKRDDVRLKKSKKIKELYQDPNSIYNSIEFKNKRSISMKNCWSDPLSSFRQPEFKQLISVKIKEVHKRNNFSEKISRIRKSNWDDLEHIYNSDNYKKVIGTATRNNWLNSSSIYHTEEYQKRRYLSIQKYWSKEKRQILSLYMKEKWINNEEYRNNVLNSLKLSPNSCEIKLFKIIEELYPEEYRFVGNGKVWIHGKNPDFIHKKSRKIIEFFGDYFHSEKLTGLENTKHEQERIDHFSKNGGFKTLVIWESELKNIEILKEKIASFHIGEIDNGKN